MSKIKTSKVEPRTPQGTLVLGSDEGTVMFEGTVVLPTIESLRERIKALEEKVENDGR